MSTVQEFRTLADSVLTELEAVLATTDLGAYDAAWTAARANYDALFSTYDALYGKTTSRSKLNAILDNVSRAYMNAKKHRDTLKQRDEDPQPLNGGRTRKWTKPRKMTRRYCKQTSCRKMGFTQKASCRPWKNCY